MITLFNIISIVVLVRVVGITLSSYRYLKRQKAEAEGFCEINERGEIGTSDEGDIIGGA